MEQEDRTLLTKAFQALDENKYDDFLKLLPQITQQINEPDPMGETLLIKEIRKKFPNVEAVSKVLKLPSINTEMRDTKFKMTPLIHAFSTKNQELWALFAAHPQVNINAVDTLGDTVLIRELTYSSYPDMKKIELILSRDDIDIDKRNLNGLSALDIATKQEQEKGPKYYKVVPLLKEAKARIEKQRLDKEAEQRSQALEQMIENRLRPLEHKMHRLMQHNRALANRLNGREGRTS